MSTVNQMLFNRPFSWQSMGMETKTGIAQAVDAMGGENPQVSLAEKLGVTKQAVHIWLTQGFVPVGRARQVAKVSGVDHRLLVDPVIRDLFENP
jgi:hypothetical protein